MTRTTTRIGSAWLVVALALPALGAGSLALAPGDAAPTVWASSVISGERVRYGYDDGKLTLVNFWATWCEPCKHEMPALQKIAAAHADEVNVVGVVWDSVDDETLRGFLDSLGVGYDVVRLQRQHRHDWGGMAVLPTTFLVGRDGKVLRRYVGATDEQIAGLSVDVDAVLAGKSMPAMVVPEVGNGVTDEDRPRKPHTP